MSWVVLVATPAPVADAPPPAPALGFFTAAEARRRPIFDPETAEFVDVAIYERTALSPGATLIGPGRLSSRTETSTVVGRNFAARIDAFGYIELIRAKLSARSDRVSCGETPPILAGGACLVIQKRYDIVCYLLWD